MKLSLAAIGTAIVLSTSASAMVTVGDHLPTQPGGASQFSTIGVVETLDVASPSGSPEGDYSADGQVTASLFISDPAAQKDHTGPLAR